MKRFKVKALCSVLVDVGEIRASSFAEGEQLALRMISERYPQGRIPIVAALDDRMVLEIQAALAVREERKAP